MVDLDLDVRRRRWGVIERLDDDEFAEHRVRFGYPDEVVTQATAASRLAGEGARRRDRAVRLRVPVLARPGRLRLPASCETCRAAERAGSYDHAGERHGGARPQGPPGAAGRPGRVRPVHRRSPRHPGAARPPATRSGRGRSWSCLGEAARRRSRSACTPRPRPAPTGGGCCWCCRRWTAAARTARSQTVVGALNPQGVRITAFGAPDRRTSWPTTSCGGSRPRCRRPATSACSTGRTTRTCWPSGCGSWSPAKVWRRRYDEINEFERALAADGTVIIKVMLHISYEEQRARLLRAAGRSDEAVEVPRGRPGRPGPVGRSTSGRTRRRCRGAAPGRRRGTWCRPTGSGTATGRWRTSCWPTWTS